MQSAEIEENIFFLYISPVFLSMSTGRKKKKTKNKLMITIILPYDFITVLPLYTF